MSADSGLDTVSITMKPVLKRQYHAGLGMLRHAVEACPDPLWSAGGHTSAYWQVAYHTLFFTHFYLHGDQASFRPWEGHQGAVQHEDALTSPPDPASTRPLLPEPYSRDAVLAYWQVCADFVDPAVDAMDLGRADCGFWWYRVSKLEHQLINLRHLQHHTAQLVDRLRTATGTASRWLASGPAPGA
ncbi:MAG: hypothetical protein R2712_18130 [Vicinamibacterales bacterium]